MDQPQTILVGTDFSDISDEALRAAALYAKTFKSVSYTHLRAHETYEGISDCGLWF